MPGRKVPLFTDQIYHVFNRGIDHRTTFSNKHEYQRAIDCLKFYRFPKPPIKLSRFITLTPEEKQKVLIRLQGQEVLVEILAFCLMPNHFHLLLRQVSENGISKFLSNFQNSYTRYFNVKNKRDGALFLDQFKAVRIETDEQLMHVSRYIHLNPHTGYVVSSFKSLTTYPWSSLPIYLNQVDDFVHFQQVLNYFPSVEGYQTFILDRADYQRTLKLIEHLMLEN